MSEQETVKHDLGESPKVINELVLLASDERIIPGQLGYPIKILWDALKNLEYNERLLVKIIFGEPIPKPVPANWLNDKSRYASAVAEEDGLATHVINLVIATLGVLEGRYYEGIARDFSLAAIHYEESAKILVGLPKEGLTDALKKLWSENPETELAVEIARRILYFAYCIPSVALYDLAGDAYCLTETEDGQENAIISYRAGLKLLTKIPDDPEQVLERDRFRAHLCVSLANCLASSPENAWEQVDALYREAADLVFFKKKEEEEGDNQFNSLCAILAGNGSCYQRFSDKSKYETHIQPKVAEKHRSSLLKLRIDLAEKALDQLRLLYEDENGDPISQDPLSTEAYYLVAILSELYIESGSYKECATLVNTDALFDDCYNRWVWVELDDPGYVVPWITQIENSSFSKGLLKRPDYPEFVESQKKLMETHMETRQKLETRMIKQGFRQEELIKHVKGIPTMPGLRMQLMQQHPWLDQARNMGSILNSENLFKMLSDLSWSEVTVGYCNALEEELKPIYTDFQMFKLRQKQNFELEGPKDSPLYHLASITNNYLHSVFWKNFVQSEIPENWRAFVQSELLELICSITSLRGEAAHGWVKDQERAKRVRDVIMGTRESPGLLEKLVKLNSNRSART